MTDLSHLVTCGADVRCLAALIEVDPTITLDVLIWAFGALVIVIAGHRHRCDRYRGHIGRQEMRLIPNWRAAWRMFSVQAQGAALALLGTWQVMPQDLKAHLPTEVVFWLSMGLLVFGIVGRLIEQPKVQA